MTKEQQNLIKQFENELSSLTPADAVKLIVTKLHELLRSCETNANLIKDRVCVPYIKSLPEKLSGEDIHELGTMLHHWEEGTKKHFYVNSIVRNFIWTTSRECV